MTSSNLVLGIMRLVREEGRQEEGMEDDGKTEVYQGNVSATGLVERGC